MRWLRRARRTGGDAQGQSRADVAAAVAHLREFVASRAGVEAYVEPRTSMTPTTLVLVATSGEWTRRRVRDERAAYELARDLGVPVYDVQLTGYPPRMREWTARQRREGGG